MSGSFDRDGELEIADGKVLSFFGKKKSGKSVLAKLYFESYPGDRVVIDVAGDDGPDGEDVITLPGTVEEIPKRWPESERRHGENGEWRPMTLRYAPDAGSATFAEDVDAVVGLALRHGRAEHHAGRVGVCLLIHEIGVVAPSGRTQPHMRRALMHNRHNYLTLLMCGPRAMGIDLLVIGQSDLIHIFELPQPADRARIAENIGWKTDDLAGAVEDLGPHEYLRFDANEEKPEPGEDDLRMISCPALPEDVVRQINQKREPATPRSV